jgi:hypothetical protein
MWWDYSLRWEAADPMALIDRFGRPIKYLRISVTDRCNLRCVYCLPAEGVQWQPRENQISAVEIARIAETAAQAGVKRVRLTGGEPLVRADILEIVSRLASIPGIEEVSLTTNAMLLERLARPLAKAGLKRVNVSLDTLNADKFKRITRGGSIDRLWRGIAAGRGCRSYAAQAEHRCRARDECRRAARPGGADDREPLACTFYRAYANRQCSELGRRFSRGAGSLYFDSSNARTTFTFLSST